MRPRWRAPRRAAALGAVLALSTGLSGCARLLHNWAEVEPGRLYRSAQPSPLLLRWALTGAPEVRSIVNLRGKTPGYESALAAEHGVRLFVFDFSASRPPPQAEVERLRGILADPANWPVLLHCRNGVDRTGYAVGLFRIDQGWSPERAAREMMLYGQFPWFNRVPRAVVTRGLRAPADRPAPNEQGPPATPTGP